MNPKSVNDLAARVAKLETLLENKDLFGASGGTTYGGLNYQGSQFNQQLGDVYLSSQENGAPNFSNNLDQELADNNGFGVSDMAIFDLMQRISDLELLVSGGSNDTRQSDALDASQAVGDDASEGSGTSGGVPAGYSPITISICDNGVAKTMQVLGTTPA